MQEDGPCTPHESWGSYIWKMLYHGHLQDSSSILGKPHEISLWCQCLSTANDGLRCLFPEPQHDRMTELRWNSGILIRKVIYICIMYMIHILNTHFISAMGRRTKHIDEPSRQSDKWSGSGTSRNWEKVFQRVNCQHCHMEMIGNTVELYKHLTKFTLLKNEFIQPCTLLHFPWSNFYFPWLLTITHSPSGFLMDLDSGWKAWKSLNRCWY